MPKRNHSRDDLEELSRKIRRLERKLKRTKHRHKDTKQSTSSTESPTPLDTVEIPTDLEEFWENPEHQLNEPGDEPNESEENTNEIEIQQPIEPELDADILDILGADPTNEKKFSKEIKLELAQRLEHIATSGLEKDVRKELADKYLLPANAVKIGAPTMNAEIKAAVTEVVIRRDKGIEGRQKQIASAISGLVDILNQELEAKEKDPKKLKQIMDVCRLMCDVQHAESVTRRNFAIFSIKKDLKEHITNTKIDTSLFGENLSETIKTANAVAKSGTEMKFKSTVKPRPSGSWTQNKNLNWRAPVTARRQQGPGQQRNREPAQAPARGPTSRFYRPPMHANASKPLHHPPRQLHRR